MEVKQTIEERIVQWREYLRKHASIRAAEAEELEDHLRSHIDSLHSLGLDEDEAFLISVKRMGDAKSLWQEYSQEYSERLWKQLLPHSQPDGQSGVIPRDTLIAIGLALCAAIAVKLPALLGIPLGDTPDAQSFYLRNFSLLILPFLAGYFAWKRDLDLVTQMKVAAPFFAGFLLMNLLPFSILGTTEILASIHLPIALWFCAGFAYMGGRWDSHSQRMHLVRFSGEWVIYLALIALGGGVLVMFTIFIFGAIGQDAEPFVQTWLLPCGFAGAVIVGGWLVEAKQNIIENIAPVLTRLFTPLFALLMLSYITVMLWSGTGIRVERDVLIGFDLLLILIVGLLLYAISARDPQAPPDLFDWLQFVLVVSALLVDILALWAIALRISEFGFSPNKVAALGENLILLINLGGSAVLYSRFLFRRTQFSTLERWQTAYIPVYPIWAAIVSVLFPIVFNFQ